MKKSEVDEHAMPSLSRVLGYMAVKNLRRVDDQVEILTRLGYGDAEIAIICDLTIKKVRNARL